MISLVVNPPMPVIGRTILSPEPIERIVYRATPKTLKKIGAYVRKVARSSIRKKKKPSKPGNPPNNRTGRLKDSILFALDGDAVIVGAKAFGNKKGGRTLEKGGNVTLPGIWQKKLFTPGAPGNMGGIGPVKLYAPPGPWTYKWSLAYGYHTYKNDKIDETGYVNVLWRRLRTEKEADLAEENYDTLQRMTGIVPTNKKLGHVAPRPFMQPALQKSKRFILEQWRKALK